MNNHYDPNQPRNAEGEWTDAGGAIRKAASDKNYSEQSDKELGDEIDKNFRLSIYESDKEGGYHESATNEW